MGLIRLDRCKESAVKIIQKYIFSSRSLREIGGVRPVLFLSCYLFWPFLFFFSLNFDSLLVEAPELTWSPDIAVPMIRYLPDSIPRFVFSPISA